MGIPIVGKTERIVTKRIDRILKALAEDGHATVLELASLLEVSPATIRQDLTVLESEGLLRRVHGGAELTEMEDLSHRMAFNYQEKLRIAKKAAEHVKDGDTILVQSGSINALFVKELASVKGLTVITANAFIARAIDQTKGCAVILIGGIFQKDAESLVGNLAKLCVANLNFNKVFIGIDGFTFETGFTGREMMRAELVQDIVAKGQEIFILTDSTKFGKIAISKYCDLEEVDWVITDDQLPDDYRRGIEGKTRLVVV